MENNHTVRRTITPVDMAKKDDAYGEAARWAASEGIAGGYGNGSFGPETPITREQLAVMLCRFAQHEGYDTAQGGMAIWDYVDYDQISGYAVAAMTWAVDTGILTGIGTDTLAPGQAAQTLFALSQMAE